MLAGAAHELGHALVDLAGGLDVTSITVDRRTGHGLCSVGTFDWNNPKYLHAWLIGCVAGFEAEDRWCRQHRSGRAERKNSRTDFRNFREHAPAIDLSEAAARAIARRRLDKVWRRVENLVPRLAEHGRLSL